MNIEENVKSDVCPDLGDVNQAIPEVVILEATKVSPGIGCINHGELV